MLTHPEFTEGFNVQCVGRKPFKTKNECDMGTLWTTDLVTDSPDVDNGLVVLGTPMGTKAFVEQQANDRIEKEKGLLKELPLLKDVQAAWVLLCQSAVPRANHTIRVFPPSLSQKIRDGT